MIGTSLWKMYLIGAIDCIYKWQGYISIWEKFEDTQGVVRSRKWKKGGQHSGHTKDKQWSTKLKIEQHEYH